MSLRQARPGIMGLLVLALLSVATTSEATPEHERSGLHKAVWYHWRKRLVTYSIQDASAAGLASTPGAPPLFRDDIRSAVAAAFDTWSANQQACTDIQFL